MAKMVTINCENCGKEKEVRAADVKRGWGRFCNKSCKAVHQEKRTGQYAAYKQRIQEEDPLDAFPRLRQDAWVTPEDEDWCEFIESQYYDD